MIYHARPWIEFDLGGTHDILSWAINRPGFSTATHILWREVREEDFTIDFDAATWTKSEITAHGMPDAPCLLTSRNVDFYDVETAIVDDIQVRVLTTVGLSNAERIGTRRGQAHTTWGTINIAVVSSVPMTQSALIEGLSIAAQARTAAVMDADFPTEFGPATGTGTDCIAIASPVAQSQHHPYAGLHTALGQAIGAACYKTVYTGSKRWIDQYIKPQT